MKPMALAVLVTLAATTPAAPASSDDAGCDGITWPVQQERALFASAAKTVTAGKSETRAPALRLHSLYALTLSPHDQVSFRVKPSGRRAAEDSYAGLATLQITRPGTYRVSADQPLRVDLERGAQTIASTNYLEQPGCSAPHKIVQFMLPAGELLLELSNARRAAVRLTVTRAEPAADSAH